MASAASRGAAGQAMTTRPRLTTLPGRLYRIVSSRFPPVGIWDRIADPADFDALSELEGLTNSRIREEMGALASVPRDRRVSGAGTTPIMAAFTHWSPEPTRFSDGTFGVFYAGRSQATAIRETVFHRERFLAATQQPSQQLTVRCYLTRLRPRCKLQDVRAGHPELHDPDPASYPRSAVFARELREANANGIAYRSVRHEGGECAAVFWPDCLEPCVQGAHFAYHWDGASITSVVRLVNVPMT
jgi:hypothetical protein